MSNSNMTYHRIGNMCHVSGVLSINGLGSASGAAYVEGFPFTCENSNAAYSGQTIAYGTNLAVAQYSSISILSRINTSTAYLFLWDATTGVTNLQCSELSADGEITFQYAYRVA